MSDKSQKSAAKTDAPDYAKTLFLPQTEFPMRAGLPQQNAYDVVLRHALGVSGNRLAFGSTTGNLYVSDDRGERWATVANNLPPIYAVRFA